MRYLIIKLQGAAYMKLCREEILNETLGAGSYVLEMEDWSDLCDT